MIAASILIGCVALGALRLYVFSKRVGDSLTAVLGLLASVIVVAIRRVMGLALGITAVLGVTACGDDHDQGAAAPGLQGERVLDITAVPGKRGAIITDRGITVVGSGGEVVATLPFAKAPLEAAVALDDDLSGFVLVQYSSGELAARQISKGALSKEAEEAARFEPGTTGDLGVAATADGQTVAAIVNTVSSSNFSRGVLVMTRDAGATWSTAAAPSGGSLSSDGTNLWLVGGPTREQLYIMRGASGTWETLKPPADGVTLSTVDFGPNGEAIVGGVSAGDQATMRVYVSPDEGTTWRQLDSSVAEVGSVGAGATVVVASTEDGDWIGLDPGANRVIRLPKEDTAASDAQVEIISPNGLPAAVEDLVLLSATTAIAASTGTTCEGDKAYCTATSHLSITTDGGQTWTDYQIGGR